MKTAMSVVAIQGRCRVAQDAPQQVGDGEVGGDRRADVREVAAEAESLAAIAIHTAIGSAAPVSVVTLDEPPGRLGRPDDVPLVEENHWFRAT